MAIDIATLRIQAEFESFDSAGKSLSNFSDKASDAEKASERLERQQRKVCTATEKFVQELKKAFDVQDKLERSLKGLVGTIGGVAAAYISMDKAMSFMDRGLKFNSDMETAQIGMASLITSMVKLGDATGKPLEGMEKYTAAQGIAKDLMAEIQRLGLETTATSQELVEGVQSIMGPALQAGMALKDIPKFAVEGAQAMQTLGVPLNQMRTELEALLSGNINKAQDVLAPKLFADVNGDLKEYIKGLKESGTLIDEIMRRLEPFKLAGQDVAQTWTGLVSNFEEALDKLAGDAASGLTKSLKESVGMMSELVLTTEAGSVGINKDFQGIAAVLTQIETAIGEGIVGATKMATDAVRSLGQHINEVGPENFLSNMNQYALTAAAGLGALTVARKAANVEMKAGFGADQQVVTGLGNYVKAQTSAIATERQRLVAEKELAAQLLATAKAELEKFRATQQSALATTNATEMEFARLAVLKQEQALLANVATAQAQYNSAAKNASLVSSAFDKMKVAGQGILAMFGGLWGVALTAATVGITAFMTSTDRTTEATKALTAAQDSWQNMMKTCTDASGRLNDKLDATQKKIIELNREGQNAAWIKQVEAINEAISKMVIAKEQARANYSDFGGNEGMFDHIIPDEFIRKYDELIKKLKEDGPAGSKEFSNSLSDLHTELVKAEKGNTDFAKAIADALRDTEKGVPILTTLAERLGFIGVQASDATAQVLSLKSAMAGGWNFDTSTAEGFIKKLQGQIRDAKLTQEGLKDFKEFGKLFPQIPEKQLGDVYKQFKSGGMNKAIEAIGQETFKSMGGSAQAQLQQTLTLMKQAEAADASAQKFLKSQRTSTSASKSAASAAQRAANAQSDYTKSIKATENSIESLQQQLGLDKTEDITRSRIKVNEDYKKSIINIGTEYDKLANKKGISGEEAQKLKLLKEQEAQLKRDLALKELDNKATQKNVQIAQGQIKFYKELGQLSGKYTDTLGLQKILIAQQAEEYKNTYGIASELVDEWVRLQELQYSTDPFDGAYRGLLKFTSEYGDQAKTWEDLTYNFAKSFVDQTGDMFDEFLETGKISLDGFKDLFKSFLKQLAWQAVAQPIMVNIMGSLFGSSSGGVASAAGLMGGGSNDLIGTTTNAFFAAGNGNSGSILDMGMGLGKQYVSNKLFGGESGLLGGITDTINSTMASWFPNTFQSTAGGFAGPITNSAGVVVGESSVLPTFTSGLGAAGIGGMVGGIASPFVNNLFGIENNSGAQIGSMVGGVAGTIGGAIAAPAIASALGLVAATNAWNPVGWIAGGLAGLSAIAGGALGGALGTQPKQEPKLEVDLVGSLWKPVSDAKDMQVFDNGGPIAAWDPNTGAYRSAVETSHGAKGSWDITTAYGNVMQQVAETSWGIADALGTITDDMKTQYLKNLEELGEINIHGIHRGEWINEANIQAFADWYVGEATGNMLIALSNIDLTPLTIAADGMAADTAEELGTAIGNILSYVNIGQAIEDETMRDNFYDSIEDQMVNALGKVSLAPLAIAADGFAVDTVDELSTALKDVFTSYDLGETIQDEDLKAAYQAKMQELIESAFDGIDLSFLRVDFDQNSFAGLQQAYAAIQAWEQVEENINAVLKPTSDFVIQIEAASNQFDEWIKNLKALGWQEDAVAEVEAKRTDYMRELANNLSAEFGMFMGQTSELAASIKNAEATIDGWIDSLDKLGYSEEEIASVEARRADYLRDSVSSLTAGLDAFFNPVAEFDIAMQQAASQFDTWIASLGRLGYTQEEIIRLEGRRTEYLLEQARALREADLQNLTLRITALAKGSDSSAYSLQSLQFQQAGELESMASKYGKDSDIYSLTKNIQAIEMMQAQLDALEAQRNKYFENEIAAINKQIEANNKQAKILQDQLKLEQKKAQNLQKQIQAIEKDIAEKEKEISERERSIDQWRQLLDDMRKFRRELWASENNLMGTRYQEAYNQFDSLYERAMQGDQDAFSELQSKATDLLAIGREQLESRGEYNDAFYDVDQKLKAAQEYAARQVYEEEKQLDVLKGQLAELELQRDILQGQLDGINAQIELLNAELEKIEALNEPLYAQIEALQEQQAALNEQLKLEQEGNLTLDQINSGISGLQAAIAQQTAALVQQQQAIIQREQQAVANSNNLQSLMQAQAAYANSIAFEGKTDWNAKSTYDRILQDGTIESWYDKYGKYQGGKYVSYDTTQARQNIVANKVAALNSSAYQGRTNWTAQDFYDAIGGNTAENIDKWYKNCGIKEGISTIYKTTQTATEASTVQTVASLGDNRQKINDNMDLNTRDINRNAINNTALINDNMLLNTTEINNTAIGNTALINEQLGWGANYLNGTMTTHLTEAYDQGVSLDTLNGTQSTYWPQAITSINGVATSVTGLQSELGSMASAIGSLQSQVNNMASAGGASGGSSSGGGGFLGKYSSESEFLDAKTSQVNSINFGGRNDWTASQVKDAIQSAGGYDKWYQDYGKAEGFAEGGITPANRIYMVGERGPELMMSPRQWGVLNNEATDLLFNRPEPQMPYIPVGIDMSLLMEIRECLSELVSISRQTETRVDSVAYSASKSLDLFRTWEAEGIGIAEEKAA